MCRWNLQSLLRSNCLHSLPRRLLLSKCSNDCSYCVPSWKLLSCFANNLYRLPCRNIQYIYRFIPGELMPNMSFRQILLSDRSYKCNWNLFSRYLLLLGLYDKQSNWLVNEQLRRLSLAPLLSCWYWLRHSHPARLPRQPNWSFNLSEYDSLTRWQLCEHSFRLLVPNDNDWFMSPRLLLPSGKYLVELCFI